MTCRILVPLLAIPLVACGEGRTPGGSPAASATATAMETAASAAQTADVRPPARFVVPEGAPFPLQRFEGFLPPVWKLGDRWRTLLMEVKTSEVSRQGYVTLDEYEMRVVAVPDARGEGDYRIKAVDRDHPKHTYLLSFSARNRCLARVEEEGFEELSMPDHRRFAPKEKVHVKGGPAVPHVRRTHRGSGPPADPVMAFPCLPDDAQNPWIQDAMYKHSGMEYPPDFVWQLVEDRGDRLVFNIGRMTFFNPPYEPGVAVVPAAMIVEWRRGAPWWTLVRETGKFSPSDFGLDPSQSPEEQAKRNYHELSDGHLVVGRLLGPDEKRPVWPPPEWGFPRAR